MIGFTDPESRCVIAGLAHKHAFWCNHDDASEVQTTHPPSSHWFCAQEIMQSGTVILSHLANHITHEAPFPATPTPPKRHPLPPVNPSTPAPPDSPASYAPPPSSLPWPEPHHAASAAWWHWAQRRDGRERGRTARACVGRLLEWIHRVAGRFCGGKSEGDFEGQGEDGGECWRWTALNVYC